MLQVFADLKGANNRVFEEIHGENNSLYWRRRERRGDDLGRGYRDRDCRERRHAGGSCRRFLVVVVQAPE